MDKTQLPQDFGLFRTFFAEDYMGSIEGVKMSYMPPKNGQTQQPKDFGLFRTFFAEDYMGSSEGVKMSYVPP